MDNQEFFDLYMADAKEHINTISQTIINLEIDPTNEEYIQEIFRAAHSIKGSAGQMQFNEIANLTHKLEDLFGAIRDKKILVNAQVIDLVFKVLDSLEALHDKLEDESLIVELSVVNEIISLLKGDSNAEENNLKQSNQETNNEISSTTSRLDDPIIKDRILTPDILEILEAIDLDGLSVYYISSDIDLDCPFKGVRAYMLLDVLASCGEIIATYPEHSTLEDDGFNESIIDVLIISNKASSEIKEMVNTVTDITAFEVTKIPNSSEEISIVTTNTNNSDTVVKSDNNNSTPNETKIDGANGVSTGTSEATKEIPNTVEKEVKTTDSPTNNNKTKAKTKSSKDANLFVRVPTKTLDILLNEQGELLLEYNRLCSVIDRVKREELTTTQMLDLLDDIATNVNKINVTQQSTIMSTRMFPLEQLFSLFPRMIRDLSNNLDKKIALVMEGQDTELDRTILEKVSDPLKHIIRNAADHGIEVPEVRLKAGKPEKGTITLSAKQESDSVLITVKDDGKGLDAEALKRKAIEKGLYTEAQVEKLTKEEVFGIIFMPGFSTASVVTEVSGRGVGMDIVKSCLAEIGGVVIIDSKLGEGTTFTVKIPLTLAISQALLVNVDKEKYVILLNYIQEVTEVNRATDIKRIQHKDHIVVRGDSIYPLVYLRDVYGYPEQKKEKESIILISNNGRQIGLVADRFIGQQDIVVKSLNRYFAGEVNYESGITKLGDGSIPIVVDIPSVMEDF